MYQTEQLPYMINGSIQINYARTTNYRALLQRYDPNMLNKMQNFNELILKQQILQFVVRMQPQNLTWSLFKNKDQIQEFLTSINVEIIADGKFVELYQRAQDNLFDTNNCMNFLLPFLNAVASDIYLRKTQQFLLFIEHCVPVDKWDMMIYKQMTIQKQPGFVSKFTNMFSSQTKRKRDFFITITSDGILKSDNHLLQSRITFMMPFTNQLTIQFIKDQKTNYISYTIQSCAHEQLVINFFNHYKKAISFIISLQMALDGSSYANPQHRFSSYSPFRDGCASKLYVDGGQYFKDMYQQMKNAKKQICITGWMITPYLLLDRPNSIESKQHRLDGVLEQCARRGVKIYIIVFMEPKLVLNNDSQNVQKYLQSLHDNIKVYRHPNGTIPVLWSHHQKLVIIDQQIGFMGGLDICYGRWDYYQHRLTDIDSEKPLWSGADYCNYRIRDIATPRNFTQSNLQKNFEVRMPWHDIALQFRGDVVVDLLRHFVQYWYFVKSQLLTDPFKTLNFLKKRYEQAFYSAFTKQDKQIAQYYHTQISKRQQALSIAQKMKYMINGRQERFPELLIQAKVGNKVGNERLQMCRSASEWSIGVRNGRHQSSIHEAYQALIKESESFIYIENQFFMGLQNKIVECMAQRIIKAYKNRQKFKIIVVTPLLPGFQGDISNPESTVLRIQVHYQFDAIIRNKNTSLAARLQKQNIPNIQDYIHFFGLRTSQLVGQWPRTQIIYVHSKLMIVDDKRCIIGSANINDRSLLGTRDSQLACVIQQRQGNIYDLRKRIFQQHFGLSQQKIRNITRDDVWQQMITNSAQATQFYRKFFRSIPDQNITTRFDVQRFGSQLSQQISKYGKTPEQSQQNFINQYIQQKKRVVGHAVDFPLSFMKDQDLSSFGLNQKQYYAPASSFT